MINQLIPFEPIHELDRFRNEISRLFNDSLGRLPSMNAGTNGLIPPADIYASNNELFVFIGLPGCSSEDVDVSATKDTLTITGEVKAPNVPEGTTSIRLERSYGKFQRVFRLPVPIDPGKVSASFKDGVLGIQMPISEEVKGRPVKIEVR